ncbi:ZP domain-containing protein-like [Hydractinia symbiolongicarpus]|uniref:ZP domain-containing protein-like n=1 Tax=Hydractinia symbiolongicarpus TaxID=13093 RepID=UPI00254EA224|nr:ZP domain-containing protein-like [Hydractinia symbiolongicarpus]
MVNRVGVHISKQQRYLIFKKMGSLMLLMNIKLSKAQVREYHSSPVTMAIETTIQRWRIKLQLSEKSQKLNSLIQLHCTYGPSRISRRQKLVIANGCSKEDAWRVDVNPYDNTVTIKSEIFSHARENNKPYFMTCAVSVCSKHDPMCMTEHCNEEAPRRTIRSVSSSGSRTQLTCHSNSITLTVRKPLPGNIPADSLHLRDPECKANENSTHVTITTKVNQCGTKLTRKTYYVEYSNVLLEKLPETLIIRRDLVQIPFRCTYSQSPLARALSIKYETQSVKFRSHAFGSYSVNIGLYSDSNYTKTNTESLVDIDSDRDMYFEVKITSPQLNLALFLDKCFGAPLHRTTQSEEYAFIENGCALDDTLKFYKTDDFSKIQFSIKPFTFTDNSSNVVINCYVTACNAQESNTKCRKGCQDNNNQS